MLDTITFNNKENEAWCIELDSESFEDLKLEFNHKDLFMEQEEDKILFLSTNGMIEELFQNNWIDQGEKKNECGYAYYILFTLV